MSSQHDRSTLWLVFLPSLIQAVDARNTSHFDRDQCLSYVVGLQSEPGWSKNTGAYFAGSPDALLNGTSNMTLTLRGCQEFCGPRSFYWDAGPRLVTWIVPVLLLLSNIELSPIDKKRFMTIIHALGDPIDSFWSIMHKIYIWHRLYKIGLLNSPASLEEMEHREMSLKFKLGLKLRKIRDSVRLRFQSKTHKDVDQSGNSDRIKVVKAKPMSQQHRARIIATVLSGFEEISGSKIKTEMHYRMIIRKLLKNENGFPDEMKFEEWRKCARILADARTNEYLRTCLSIAVYFLGLIAAFVPSVGGGNTSPPGGRIGAALFLSWLVPLALLSNRVGAFTSRRACLHIMRGFIAATTGSTKEEPTSRFRVTSDASDISPTQPSAPCVMSGGWDSTEAARKSSNARSAEALSHGAESSSAQVINDSASEWAGKLRTRFSSMSKEPTAQLKSIDQYAGRESEEEETDLGVSLPTDSRTPLLSGPVRNPIHNASMEMQDFKPKKENEIPQINTDTQISKQRKRQTKVGLIRHTTWDEHFLSLQWLGAIYTYRPWKVQYMHVDHRTHAKRNSWLMAFAGLFPVFVSAVGASAILWYAVPPGFSCRSIWAVAIFVLWIFSALITTAVYVYSDRKEWIQEEEASRPNTEQLQAHLELGHDDNEDNDKESRSQKDPAQKLWTWVLIKDAVVAAACVVVIFLSTAGMFNSCYCWSVNLTRKNNPVVPLNTDKSYEENAIKIYSGVVITCIGIQVLFVFAIMWYWSGGLRVVRWSEKDKRTEWAHESEETVMWTEKSLLLFWYYKEDLEIEEMAREDDATKYQQCRRPTFIEENIRKSLSRMPKGRSQNTIT